MVDGAHVPVWEMKAKNYQQSLTPARNKPLSQMKTVSHAVVYVKFMYLRLHTR